jgi:hypothetical protein
MLTSFYYYYYYYYYYYTGDQGCRNPDCQVAMANETSMVAFNVFVS